MNRFSIALKKPAPPPRPKPQPLNRLGTYVIEQHIPLELVSDNPEALENLKYFMAHKLLDIDSMQWSLDGDRTRNFHVLREIPIDMSTQDRVRLRMSMSSELVNHAMRANCFNITFSENPNYAMQTITLEGELRV